MSKLIIFIGNIGTGKSLIASKLAKQGMVIANMDSIQAIIAGGEYGLYDNAKKEIYHKTEETIISTGLQNNFDVVIDRTNMDRKGRQRFIKIGKKYNAKIECYHFGAGISGIECIKNRMKNPRGISQETWQTVYKKMFDSYEKPDETEGFSCIKEM